MNNQSEKRIVARWQTKARKTWLELYRDEFGYCYRSSNGGGNFGALPDENTAIAQADQRVEWLGVRMHRAK